MPPVESDFTCMPPVQRDFQRLDLVSKQGIEAEKGKSGQVLIHFIGASQAWDVLGFGWPLQCSTVGQSPLQARVSSLSQQMPPARRG